MRDGTLPPLRLLLLERQGDRDAAWWRQAFGAPRVDRLLAPDAPQVVPLIEDPALRWAIFAEGHSRANGGAAQARDVRLDCELGRVSAGGEPLFLGMFGLMAARIGLDAAAGLARNEVALHMADEELPRVRKAWAMRGGGASGDADLPALLTAMATLAEGRSAAEAHTTIARECAALRLGTPATEPVQGSCLDEVSGLRRRHMGRRSGRVAAWRRLRRCEATPRPITSDEDFVDPSLIDP